MKYFFEKSKFLEHKEGHLENIQALINCSYVVNVAIDEVLNQLPETDWRNPTSIDIEAAIRISNKSLSELKKCQKDTP